VFQYDHSFDKHASTRAMYQGHEWRTVGTTAINEKSSRSHTIFRLVIESKAKAETQT
jgi:hypothetical protein